MPPLILYYHLKTRPSHRCDAEDSTALADAAAIALVEENQEVRASLLRSETNAAERAARGASARAVLLARIDELESAAAGDAAARRDAACAQAEADVNVEVDALRAVVEATQRAAREASITRKGASPPPFYSISLSTRRVL